MKEELMEIEWRTIQFFLSEEGVSEVSADIMNPSKVRCSCTKFVKSAKCKHVDFIKARMSSSGGAYVLRVPPNVTEEEEEAAFESTDAFRNFVIKYGTPEIL
jgi:hypothetical protein